MDYDDIKDGIEDDTEDEEMNTGIGEDELESDDSNMDELDDDI